MLFKIPNILLTLLAVSASVGTASAAPNTFINQKRSIIDPGEPMTCTFLFKPNTPETPLTWDEFDTIIDQAIQQATGGSNTFFLASKNTENADQTYTVNAQFATEHHTAAEIIPIIDSLVGTTLKGLVRNWLVESASCVPSKVV
ncbi:hypothetical protein GALMADRAFT_133897 [Galerina marginata CBS 339.88]|uniref:ABM domain-containing protein n=1 Tax=Galerina marginata (strain CBS 339.88) TaxID=685588 RepID=A0A067TN99_GALM3|nr:hypothetical protein GALMADRAFT_133897 [Galerina marginata CBS 339.88]